MKSLFDKSSYKICKVITNDYSTSFSMGIFLLNPKIRPKIYAIYGFVRLADEIVDSFDGYDQEYLLKKLIEEYHVALEQKISLNPVLNAFQEIVNRYKLESLVEQFLDSMKMDLHKTQYDSIQDYEKYILGSAEVVGLMCLKVFTEGNEKRYNELKPFAMKLGSAFQKVNFLRDMQADYHELGRMYFPNVSFDSFTESVKQEIVNEIEDEFSEALKGIIELPMNCRLGVYVAYKYYLLLLLKLKNKKADQVLKSRTRVSNFVKGIVFFKSYIRYQLNVL